MPEFSIINEIIGEFMFKILIVEDDHSNYILLKKVITSRFSAELFRAENGLEALKFLESNDVDGVILDISMPVMNGLEVLETIRNDDRISHLPVIMLSAINSRQEVEKAMKFGVFDYLLKPFYAEQTMHRLKHFFEHLAQIMEMKNSDEEGGGKKHALIISPNKKKWEETIAALSDSYEFKIFPSGTSGLEYFLKEFPDICVLDKNLPAISEIIIAKKIKTTLSEKHHLDIELKCSVIGINDTESDWFDFTIKSEQELTDVLVKIPN